MPPYEGRQETAKKSAFKEAESSGGPNTGGAGEPVVDSEFKAPPAEETPGGRTASPADEQPAAEATESASSESGVGAGTSTGGWGGVKTRGTTYEWRSAPRTFRRTKDLDALCSSTGHRGRRAWPDSLHCGSLTWVRRWRWPSPVKPVLIPRRNVRSGTVWFGIVDHGTAETEKQVFSGDPDAVLGATVEHAIQLLLRHASDRPHSEFESCVLVEFSTLRTVSSCDDLCVFAGACAVGTR